MTYRRIFKKKKKTICLHETGGRTSERPQLDNVSLV